MEAAALLTGKAEPKVNISELLTSFVQQDGRPHGGCRQTFQLWKRKVSELFVTCWCVGFTDWFPAVLGLRKR